MKTEKCFIFKWGFEAAGSADGTCQGLSPSVTGTQDKYKQLNAATEWSSERGPGTVTSSRTISFAYLSGITYDMLIPPVMAVRRLSEDSPASVPSVGGAGAPSGAAAGGGAGAPPSCAL